ncbi:MAG: amidohydrolase family protein [Betaproteobacteria bacterium]|nr:amidohydrolase family protein [Betaproteobacteria bacterium]
MPAARSPPNQSPPKRALPAGAWDCHTHIFGPYERFPLAAERSYTPPPAPVEVYLAMLDRVGLARGVLVHPSAYGLNHEALLDALDRAGSRLRGTAVATSAVTDAELAAMHRRGVRALRFVDAGAPSGGRFAGAVGLDEFSSLAPRLKELGWHAQFWATCDTVIAAAPMLLASGIPLVLDHMARFDVTRGVQDAAFQELLELLTGGSVWVKMSPARNSKLFPDFEDVRPFHDALARTNPDRLLWGSDWPYLRMGEATPDAGHLLDLLDFWCGEDGLRHKILVDNPARLYGIGAGIPD